MEANRTPLNDSHVAAGAYMADFAGWNMPIYYSSIIEEHNAVRKAAGLFDLCHMGLLRVTGAGTSAFLQKTLANSLSKAAPFRALYSPVCYENGTTVDDIIAYCLAENDYILIVNASNKDKDLDWFRALAKGFDVKIADMGADYGLIGVQGPQAFEAAYTVLGQDFSTLDYFSFCSALFGSKDIYAARTGYTGEKGVELVVPTASLSALWESFSACPDVRVSPVGLGARDSLRLEMGYCLYGHELSDAITPLEAGIGWAVDLNKDFIGRDALAAAAPKRVLSGFILNGRMIARHGVGVFDGERRIGTVTSGGYSPVLEKSIGLALVEADAHAVDKSVRFNTRKDKFVNGSFCPRSFLESRVK